MSDATHAKGMSGSHSPPELFRFVEGSSHFDPRDVIRVLRGEVVGCVFRNVIPTEVCKQVALNFWNHSQLRRRGDEVPAHVLGTYHYFKTLTEYLNEAEQYREAMREIFAGCGDVFDEVMTEVASVLAEEDITMRVASHNGRAASEFVMRSWSGPGLFALEPHDDGAQLSQSQQHGFEIQRVATAPVVAFNMCFENTSGGELHYWNLVPDNILRKQLGLEDSGYPYPLKALEGIDKLTIPVHAGDVYFFNGKYIHAVGAQQDSTGSRSTISGIMGFVDPNTVLYWS
jgi:hypothetical protein